MKFTNDDIEKFKKSLLNEETKIIDLSDEQCDKSIDSHSTHSTRFDLSDVVELISSVTIEKIKREMELK